MNNQSTITISAAEAGKRLDIFVAQKYPDYSRTHLSSLIKNSDILVNSNLVKPSYILKDMDRVDICLAEKQANTYVAPQHIELNILYEDENVIVINKQPGLVVHPAAGNKDHTLVNALVHYFPQIQEAVYEKGNTVSEARPGLVHRLDKDTSGVIIIAKNARAMHSLSRQIQNRTVKKCYVSLNYGWPKEESGEIINNIGRSQANRKVFVKVEPPKGREAISHFTINKLFTDKFNHKFSMINFEIRTGRTHQIRVHSKILGTPVIGDKVYNTKDSAKFSELYGAQRQFLHAYKLSITLPGDNKPTEFVAPIPQDFVDFTSKLIVKNIDQ
ncbi:MAG: RluA family pseudouridine synthase [bacterium]